MKIYIDPACNFLYSSFYIKGLIDKFGKKGVCFSSKPFINLRYGVHTHVFVFVANNKKYVIDFADSNQIFYENFLAWSDVYAKVNYNKNYLPTSYVNKVVKCGCNYGMVIYKKKIFAAIFALKNYLLSKNRIDFSFRTFLSRYIISTKKQMPIPTINQINNNNYIFFVSSYWEGQENCNKSRANFIRACHNLEKKGIIRFEGGLVCDSNLQINGYDDVLLNKRFTYTEYITKLQQSLCVFNTPAYSDCHGWKLAEYIAMEKVIVSTPFINELPHEMCNKDNILFCQNTIDDIEFKLKELINNKDLANRIKRGVCKYNQQYATPRRVIEYLVDR